MWREQREGGVIRCEEEGFHHSILRRWTQRREEGFNLHVHVSKESQERADLRQMGIFVEPSRSEKHLQNSF